MARWQNLQFIVVPAIESAVTYVRRASAGDWSRVGHLARQNAAFALAAAAAFSPQLLVWKLERGGWLDVPSEEHPIYWTMPAIGRELFSPDRGLFTWTPLLAFALVGVFIFAWRHRMVGVALLGAFVAQVYISSTILSIGHGHGARKFTNCALIFCVGLAALIDWLRRRPLVTPYAAAAALVVVNVFFMLDLDSTNLQQRGAVSFSRMIEATSARVGHPFALPMNAWTAWKYDADLSLYERLGSQTFNNVGIDFGEAGDDRFLASGWSGRERNDEFSYRWATGTSSSFVVPLRESVDYRLTFRAGPFVYEGSPAQVVEVWVNDMFVERIVLANQLKALEIVIPAAFIRGGLNEVRFQASRATAPASLGLSGDARELSLLFDRVDLIR